MKEFAWAYQGFAVLLGMNMLLTEGFTVQGMIGKDSEDRMYANSNVFVYAGAFNVAQLVNIFVGHLCPERFRIVFGLLAACSALLLVPLAVSVMDKTFVVWIAFAATAVYGFGSSLFQATMNGVASRDGLEYMGKYSFGHSLAGLPCWPLHLIIRACTSDPVVEVFLTFVFASLLTGLAYFVYERSIVKSRAATRTLSSEPDQFTVYDDWLQAQPYKKPFGTNHPFWNEIEFMDDETEDAIQRDLNYLLSDSPINRRTLEAYHSDEPKKSAVRVSCLPDAQTCIPTKAHSTEKISLMGGVGMHAFNVWFNCAVTFTVFPTEIQLWNAEWNSNVFHYVPVFIFVYQLADCIGRFLVDKLIGVYGIPNKYSVFAMNIGRAILVGAGFYLTRTETWVFGHGVFRGLLLIFHAMCCGFIITWCMISGPQEFKDPKQMTKAGYILGFGLTFGILCGSGLGALISYLTT